MANSQNDTKSEDLRSYARKHPTRMNSGSMLVGTLLGATLVAVKNRRGKSQVQKFMDRLNK
jgi:hypothetical protein